MGQAQLTFKPPLPSGPFRRVFRQGVRFLCGICRSGYEDEGSAQSCLRRCWHEFLASYPVMLAVRNKRAWQRCRLCCRDYTSRSAAEACAADCKERYKRLYAIESKLAESGDLPPPPKRNFKPRSAAIPLVPHPVAKPVRKLQRSTALEQPDSKPVNADISAPPSEPLAEADSASAPKKKKRPSEMFYRDGAKYACSICNERYFTKNEVVACFEKHDDYE